MKIKDVIYGIYFIEYMVYYNTRNNKVVKISVITESCVNRIIIRKHQFRLFYNLRTVKREYMSRCYPLELKM